MTQSTDEKFLEQWLIKVFGLESSLTSPENMALAEEEDHGIKKKLKNVSSRPLQTLVHYWILNYLETKKIKQEI